MPQVTFVAADGQRIEVDAPDGANLMRVALENGVEGILAECGGSLACGTCHVYVEPAQFHRMDPPDDVERDMLDGLVGERRCNSRLACQVRLTAVLGALEVRIAEVQG